MMFRKFVYNVYVLYTLFNVSKIYILPPCSATFCSIDGGTYSCGNSWNISCAPLDTFPELS